MKGSWKRKEIVPVALEIQERFHSLNIPFSFVGSFRRRAPILGDLDIMFLEGTDLRTVMDPLRVYWLRSHKPLPWPRCLLRNLEIKFFPSDSDHWGAGLLAWTGDGVFLRRIRTRARKLGMKLTPRGLFDSAGLLEAKKERQIFYILGLDFIEPMDRTHAKPGGSREKKIEVSGTGGSWETQNETGTEAAGQDSQGAGIPFQEAIGRRGSQDINRD